MAENIRGQESISESLISSSLKVLLLRAVFIFEPLAPTAITLLINRQMAKFRNGGVIGKYKTVTKRLGRFHYRIQIELDLTGLQAVHLFSNIFPNQLNGVRRWFHD
jgi:hypothetical protein